MRSNPTVFPCRLRIARHSRWALGAMVGLGVTLAAPSIGQPDRGRPSPPQPQTRDAEAQPLDVSPERLRARLATLLEELDAGSARIRRAVETLDNGGSSAEAMEQIGGAARVRRLAEFWGQWSRYSQADGRIERPDPERGVRGGPGERSPDLPTLPGDEISAEDVSAFLETHAPEFAARLRSLREQDARRGEFFLNRLRPRIGEILTAQQHDPALADLLTREFRVNMDLLDAGRRYARALAANDPKLDQTRETLRALAGEQVDIRLARREHEIRSLAEKIESLRTDVEQQRDNREQLIVEIIERAGRVDESGGPGGPERRGAREGRPDRSGDE